VGSGLRMGQTLPGTDAGRHGPKAKVCVVGTRLGLVSGRRSVECSYSLDFIFLAFAEHVDKRNGLKKDII